MKLLWHFMRQEFSLSIFLGLQDRVARFMLDELCDRMPKPLSLAPLAALLC
jgi:hypothetical protein